MKGSNAEANLADHTLDSGLTVINSHLSEDEKGKYLRGGYRIRLIK